jgi:hypothetical protein
MAASKTAHGNPTVIEREALAVTLRKEGKPYRDIGVALGVSESRAHHIVSRALRRTVQEPSDELRRLERERLDALEVAAWRQLNMDHVMVSHGKVVPGVIDEAAKLAALDRLLKIQERRARLLGLDAPTRHQVLTMDAVDEEIARLEGEMEARSRAVS